jgi:RimJ/RimL family protein N-acetyltransferase
MNIEIKRLDVNRWQDCRDLRLEALKNEPLAYSSSYEEEQVRPEAFWQDSVKLFLFALADNQLVGMAGIFQNNRIKTNHFVEIFGVYVKKEYRGQGTGKRLVEAVLTEIHNLPGVKKIKIGVNPTQKTAAHIYKKLGFKEAGRFKKDVCVNGKFYDEIIMEKFL